MWGFTSIHRTAKIIWVIKIIRTAGVISSKQNCLRCKSLQRVGVTQSGCWVVGKALILQGFLALSIWKNQRKSLVDTKLIPPLSGYRIIPKSLKARKFVFLKTNLRAFFTVILRILWNTMKRGANQKFFQKFFDTGWILPLWNSESVKGLETLSRL